MREKISIRRTSQQTTASLPFALWLRRTRVGGEERGGGQNRIQMPTKYLLTLRTTEEHVVFWVTDGTESIETISSTEGKRIPNISQD